jgi:hypothetical protein
MRRSDPRPADGSPGGCGAEPLAFARSLGHKVRALSTWLRRVTPLVGFLTLAPAAYAEEPVQSLDSRPELLPPPQVRARIALAGLSVTAGSYALSLGASYLFPDPPGAEALRLPVVGPWLALSETGCPDDDPNCPVFPVVLRAVLTSIDGIMQIGGLAIASESLWLPTRSAHSARVRAAPIPMGRGGLGVGVIGRF